MAGLFVTHLLKSNEKALLPAPTIQSIKGGFGGAAAGWGGVHQTGLGGWGVGGGGAASPKLDVMNIMLTAGETKPSWIVRVWAELMGNFQLDKA